MTSGPTAASGTTGRTVWTDGEAAVSELTLMLIRFAYLAILWIFVLAAISVVRSDMFGARVDSTPRADRKADKQARRQGQSRGGQSRGKPSRKQRGAPTHVAVVEGAN